MAWAADDGRENIVRLYSEWGDTDVDRAMAFAASDGHESIVRLCRNWGAHEIDLAMAYAAEGRESVTMS